jgi:hypothetical protein
VCLCSGSLKYLHVTCLQEWLKVKLITQSTDRSIHYYWKALECEVCNTTLPTSIEVQGSRYELVNIARPGTPFLVLERLQEESRSHHLIKFLDTQSVVVGRSSDCDVKLTDDISVSRTHASITRVDKGFFLQDCNSKFGTLVFSSKPLVLAYGDSAAIQVNRTVVLFHNPDVWSFKRLCRQLCCFKPRRATVKAETSDNLESQSTNTAHPLYIYSEENQIMPADSESLFSSNPRQASLQRIYRAEEEGKGPATERRKDRDAETLRVPS